MNARLFGWFVFGVVLSSSQTHTVQAAEASLTLDQVLRRVQQAHPEHVVFAHSVRAGEGRLQQATVLPNPDLGLAVEDVGGTGGVSGVRQAQTTFEVRQPLEIGGQRKARGDLAQAELAGIRTEQELKGWELDVRARQAFYGMLAAQEFRDAAQDNLKVSESVLATVRAKVAAGKVSSVQETRALAARAEAEATKAQTQAGMLAARESLAALLGEMAPSFDNVTGTWTKQALDYTVLHASVTEAPEVRLAGLVVQVREASVELERRRRIPDLTVGAGYRHLNGTDDHAMVFSVSVPWPLFNRNQGNQITAQAQAQQAQAAQQAALRRVRQRLGQLWGEYSGAQAEVLAVESQLLPELDKAFNATMEGYEAGKFAYLETLETQQSLIKARERLISARHKAQKAQLDIEQLLGRSTRNPIP